MLKWRDDLYAAHHPGPEDVLLLVEVSDTSLTYDRKVRVPLYAEAGISRVWLVNLSKNAVEIYSSPIGGKYQQVEQAEKEDELTLLPDLAVAFTADDILG